MTTNLPSLLLATLLSTALAAPAFGQSEGGNQPDEQSTAAEISEDSANIVKSAAGAVERLAEQKKFAETVGRAKAVVIFPDVVKGGFLISDQAGNGVLLVRRTGGSWSAPAFYTIAAVGIGLKAGMEVSMIDLIVLSDAALASFYDEGFKLGDGVDLTVATLGGDLGIDTSVDMVGFTATRGAFAGLSLEGSKFSAEPERYAAYYGRELTTEQVILVGACGALMPRSIGSGATTCRSLPGIPNSR